jgi:hypothetical protein
MYSGDREEKHQDGGQLSKKNDVSAEGLHPFNNRLMMAEADEIKVEIFN